MTVAIERMRMFLATPEGQLELLKETLLHADRTADPQATAYQAILKRAEEDARRIEREQLSEAGLQAVDEEVKLAEYGLEHSDAGRQLLQREIAKLRQAQAASGAEIPDDAEVGFGFGLDCSLVDAVAIVSLVFATPLLLGRFVSLLPLPSCRGFLFFCFLFFIFCLR